MSADSWRFTASMRLNLSSASTTGVQRDSEKLPRLVNEVGAVLRKFAPVIATEVKPASPRNQLFWSYWEKEGLNAFEWVEEAVRTYRFLYAWNLVAAAPTSAELDQLYSWALRQGEAFRFRNVSLLPPKEQLALPESLKNR